jgi:agmatine deiminase
MNPDWQTNCVYLAASVRRCHPAMWQALQHSLRERGIELRSVHGTRDIWLRDFMPIQVADDDFVKFRYEPDYLRIGHKHLMTAAATCLSTVSRRKCQTSRINLDGGNIVAAKRKAILTEKVFRENRQIGRSELVRELHRLLRVEECIFVPEEPGDLFGHADGMIRFLDETTVLVNDYTCVNRAFGTRLLSVLRKQGLACEAMPYLVEEEQVEGIPSAVGCYINFLWVGPLIVVPTFGTATDARALSTLEKLLPGRELVPLPCTELAREGGVLRCVSWTILDRNATRPGKGRGDEKLRTSPEANRR